MKIRDRGVDTDAEELTPAPRIQGHSADNQAGRSQALGLYVVGMLARKHGVRVRLHAYAPVGLAVLLVLSSKFLGPPTGPGTPQPGAPRPAPSPVVASATASSASLPPSPTDESVPKPPMPPQAPAAVPPAAAQLEQPAPERKPQYALIDSGLSVRTVGTAPAASIKLTPTPA
ncbi:hypothetical protein [Streptomyces sp. x-19]|uniref:hypothetical protein n=1 Tax=Streptomyces sp. x-19 TaxID=2789280 RepID=UPI00397F95F6